MSERSRARGVEISETHIRLVLHTLHPTFAHSPLRKGDLPSQFAPSSMMTKAQLAATVVQGSSRAEEVGLSYLYAKRAIGFQS